MLAQDFSHIQIEYLIKSIGLSNMIERSESINLQFSIFNLQFRLRRLGILLEFSFVECFRLG